jgi:hypothetical protein
VCAPFFVYFACRRKTVPERASFGVFLSRKVRTYGSSSSLVRFPPNFCFGARVHWQFIYNK